MYAMHLQAISGHTDTNKRVFPVEAAWFDLSGSLIYRLV